MLAATASLVPYALPGKARGGPLAGTMSSTNMIDGKVIEGIIDKISDRISQSPTEAIMTGKQIKNLYKVTDLDMPDYVKNLVDEFTYLINKDGIFGLGDEDGE